MITGRVVRCHLIHDKCKIIIGRILSVDTSFSGYNNFLLPPGGRGNLRIVPSVSLHAVKGSEWIMWEWYWEAAHSQLFPRGTPWPVDWRNYLFHSWLYAGFGGAGRASGLMFHCHDTFNLEVSQTHATCTSPTELDFVIHRENWLKTFRRRRITSHKKVVCDRC